MHELPGVGCDVESEARTPARIVCGEGVGAGRQFMKPGIQVSDAFPVMRKRELFDVQLLPCVCPTSSSQRM